MSEQKQIEELKKLLPGKRGKRSYAERLGVSIEEIERLIKKVKHELEDIEEGIEGDRTEDINYEKGTKKINLRSSKPLSPEELKTLAGVDDLTSYIARSWLKSSDNSSFWDYSIDTRYRINDFYTGKQFEAKLKELFPKSITKYRSITRQPVTDKVLMCYIGDDHCGLILKDSQYGNEHNEEIYRGRLDQLYEVITQIGITFSKIYLVSLGDELDGYNGYTTRGGHQLGSGSNKEQFDIYVNSRRYFYDKLFTSGISKEYTLINQNNSNHSGKGLSYMANRALEIYIECRFDNVYVIQTDKMIQVIEVGNHIFGFVHGKDETHQKNPLPLNLDPKADAYLFEFYDKQGYSPSRNWISTIKADIHKFNLNMGKHGRYVNIPSIGSGSNWIEANFGNSQPGVLLEVVDPNSKNIHSIPVWF